MDDFHYTIQLTDANQYVHFVFMGQRYKNCDPIIIWSATV